jgi:hypothetical protein
MTTTTNIEILRKRPYLFPFGLIIKIHEIDRYVIVEAESGHKHTYHSYVMDIKFPEGRCLGRSADSLDEALIICMAYDRLGNAQSTDYMANAAFKLLTPI